MDSRPIKEIFEKTEDLEFLKSLGYDVEKPVDQVNSKTKSMILHDAVVNKKTDLVEILINKCQIDLNKPDPSTTEWRMGKTPLLLAIVQHDKAMVKLLLDNNADPTKSAANSNKTPLMSAAAMITAEKEKEIFEALAAKADINQEIKQEKKSEGGDLSNQINALICAAQTFNLFGVETLLRLGASSKNSQEEEFYFYCFNESLRKKMLEISQKVFEKASASEPLQPKKPTSSSNEKAPPDQELTSKTGASMLFGSTLRSPPKTHSFNQHGLGKKGRRMGKN